MELYTKMRTELSSNLGINFNNAQVEEILKALDQTFCRYDVVSKETSLANPMNQVTYIVNLYVACKKLSGYSEGTINMNKGIVIEFFGMINKSPHEVVPNDIRKFIYYYRNVRKVSDRTAELYRTYLCGFFTWAFNEGLIDRDPGSNVEKIRYVGKQRHPLSKVEVEEVRRACEDKRELAIIDTFLSTGCRVSEVSNIRLSDIDWDNRSIVVLGKGSKYRTVYLNAKAEVSVKNYLSTRTDSSPYLFVGFNHPFDKLTTAAYRGIIGCVAKRSGIKSKLTPHVLRHTFATLALQAGMKVEVIQILLGHNDLRTTMVYAKISNDELRYAHNKYVT